MKYILALVLLVFANKASGEGVIQYSHCDESQKLTIELSAAYAKDMIRVALKSNDRDLFLRWFGTTDITAVKQGIEKLNEPFYGDKALTFDCTCAVESYAYVSPLEDYVINVCNKFWRADDIGYNSRAGTIIHEFSHFSSVLDTHDIAREYYGITRLAEYMPVLALTNANNWEYSLEEIYRRH